MAISDHTFFIDRCLTGRTFRDALKRAGLRIESLENHLPEYCEDADWIPLISAPPFEWVIITKDNSILSNRHEFDVICDYKARVVMFDEQDLTAKEMSGRFLGHLSEIFEALNVRTAPFIIVLHADRIQIYP